MSPSGFQTLWQAVVGGVFQDGCEEISPPRTGGGSVLSSICVSVALRPQQRWGSLTAPRGPREGTRFCVVLPGQSFWEPGHRDVGKPRGPQ